MVLAIVLLLLVLMVSLARAGRCGECIAPLPRACASQTTGPHRGFAPGATAHRQPAAIADRNRLRAGPMPPPGGGGPLFQLPRQRAKAAQGGAVGWTQHRAIVALRPDVVVMSVSSRAGERLEALGVKVVTLEPKTHADVQRVLSPWPACSASPTMPRARCGA